MTSPVCSSLKGLQSIPARIISPRAFSSFTDISSGLRVLRPVDRPERTALRAGALRFALRFALRGGAAALPRDPERRASLVVRRTVFLAFLVAAVCRPALRAFFFAALFVVGFFLAMSCLLVG
jgi:hypothetical protein